MCGRMCCARCVCSVCVSSVCLYVGVGVGGSFTGDAKPYACFGCGIAATCSGGESWCRGRALAACLTFWVMRALCVVWVWHCE